MHIIYVYNTLLYMYIIYVYNVLHIYKICCDNINISREQSEGILLQHIMKEYPEIYQKILPIYLKRELQNFFENNQNILTNNEIEGASKRESCPQR